MQRPDGAARALAVLRKPSCSPELAYRFAPGLLTAAPAQVGGCFEADTGGLRLMQEFLCICVHTSGS